MSQDVDIAVLKANYTSLERHVVKHDMRDEERFEKVFSCMRDNTDTIVKKINSLDEKVDSLWDEKNQRQGAFKLSGIIGHIITGIVAIGGFFGLERMFK